MIGRCYRPKLMSDSTRKITASSGSAPRAPGSAATEPRRIGWLAVAVWATAWISAQVAILVILAIAGNADSNELPIPTLAIASLAQWSVFLVAMIALSKARGSGRLLVDYPLRFRSIDLAGLLLGAITQLVFVPAFYTPLRQIWPGVFTDQRLEERATDLVDRASGLDIVVLFLVVAIGAPIVEEFVYRGLLQRNIGERIPRIAAWLFVAVLFTLIHFAPVEYPGLFVFALVVGACAAFTDGLSLPILVHVGFNASGLLLAL